MDFVTLFQIAVAFFQSEPSSSIAEAMRSKGSSPQPAIMITAFDPFAGADVNQSTLIGQALSKKLRHQYDVTFCQLPTVYDQAAKVALDCMAKMPVPPLHVISLGEGSCEIRIETRASNWDETDIDDNWNQYRTGSSIIEGLPYWKKLSISASDLKAALPPTAELDHVLISDNTGNFVCNNTAFRLAHAFDQPDSPKYIFIHVPNHGCERAEKNIRKNADLLATMLKSLSK